MVSFFAEITVSNFKNVTKDLFIFDIISIADLSYYAFLPFLPY